MAIFNKMSMSTHGFNLLSHLKAEIQQAPFLLFQDKNLENWTKSLWERYIEPTVVLDWGSTQIETREERVKIPSPHIFDFHTEIEVLRLVIYYKIPIQGKTELLYYSPSSYFSKPPKEATLQNNMLQLRYVSMNKTDISPIHQQFENDKAALQQLTNQLNNDLITHNNEVKRIIPSLIEQRKAEICRSEKQIKQLKEKL